MSQFDDYFAAGDFSEGSFQFNKSISDVFDNMVSRSVPLYDQILSIIQCIISSKESITTIYDWGCSTGNLLHVVSEHYRHNPLHFIAIDQSNDMLERAQKKIESLSLKQPHRFTFMCHDVNDPLTLIPHDVSVLNLTLQFVKQENRVNLLQSIYSSLVDKGYVIIIEKIVDPQSSIQATHEMAYHHYKRSQGYSESEIQNKARALKHVLVPDTIDHHLKRLINIGFSEVGTVFQWHNFCGILAIK